MTVDQDDHSELYGKSDDAGAPQPSNGRTSEHDRLAEVIQESIAKNPNVFGAADIYNLGSRDTLSRAGLLVAVLTGLSDVGRPAVQNFLVVVPAGWKAEECEAQVWKEMIANFRLLSGREMEPSAQAWFKARFRLVASRDRRSRSVLDVIAVQAERTAVIVVDAASYRDDDIYPYVTPGASAPLQPADIWAPQLHALAAAAIELARQRMLYVALDANQPSPRREALSDLLLSIDGCGVLGSSSADDPESILAARVDQWDVWIREGRLGRTLSDIEQLPAKLDANKPYLRIQVLYKAGFSVQALEEIHVAIALNRELDASSRVKLAWIAQDANAARLASEILAPVVDDLSNREDLESALATAHGVGSELLENKIAERLARMYPGSPGLKQRQQRALLAARDYAGLAAMATEEPDGQADAEFYDRLARFLSGPDVPDYSGFVALTEGGNSWADANRMACVRDALSRKLVFHALELAMPIPTTQAQSGQGAMLLLRTLEGIFLHDREAGSVPESHERIRSAMLSLIDHLAANPGEQRLRVGLAELIQPYVSGTTGLALMVYLLLDIASRGISLQQLRPVGKEGADWLLKRKPFLNSAFEWLAQEEPVVIGRSVIPISLLTEPAGEVVSAITHYLINAPLETGEDHDALLRWLALASSVSPHASDPDVDLSLIRLAAGRLADSGYKQQARDLAEQALLISGDTPRRRRLSWFAMADVYHRCHMLREGLLAIACTLAADDAGDEEQIWQEVTCAARMLRDCGLFDQSRLFIEKARDILARMALSDTYSHRLDTLELQVRQVSLRSAGADNEGLQALLSDVVQNAMAVLDQQEQTEPVAAVLGQLLRQARESGATIPPEAHEIFDKLCRYARGNLKSLIATMSATVPSAEGLLALLKASSVARFSDDVGFDMRNLALAAERSLASDNYISDAVDTSFALELLSDQGVAVPGWDEAAKPPAAPNCVEEPAEIACSIAREGLSVVQAGFDTFGRLVRVDAIGGRLDSPRREPDDVMNEERFQRWAAEYPYAYGIDETTANLFYTTTEELRLSSLPEGPVVVVADARFQTFPPNLFYVDDQFAGRSRPMAAAPSLSWLKAARAKGMIGDGRLCAWISTVGGETESQTLPMIAQRLESTFAQYEVIVDNGSTLPSTFSGASMAIISAHGGIHPEGRYFHVVSDEGGLRVTGRDLADALRNVGVVILFVCSGGRADKHPDATTTLGLAKQTLDRGCAAVVASPWPLDARVPSHWLPEFLKRWSDGASLIEANFAANQVVDQRFSQDPARGLAMTVFGNPGLCRA
ncbi:hypothetical protein THIOKS13330026 [Thiocapsa sp. KS1]|nr:CHAT domain-containing protein [Thiocapsa sp. KS1]CRI67020.1 hypothetical protein THIOKS13330026 [Thiocapsa sp. KS1]